jgi:hypothetical protein
MGCSRIDHYANCRDWFAGDEAARISWGVITSVAMVTTWFPFPGSPGNFSDDAWFISTIVFCYLMFPSILPYLQEKSRKLQQYWLWAVYLVHMATVPMLIYFFHYVMGYSYRLNDGDGVIPAELCGNIIPTYEHPLFRLPQFAMGIIAALIRQAGPSLLGKEVDPSSVTDWSNIHMRCAYAPRPDLCAPVVAAGAPGSSTRLRLRKGALGSVHGGCAPIDACLLSPVGASLCTQRRQRHTRLVT